jgi:hypothetical protein
MSAIVIPFTAGRPGRQGRRNRLTGRMRAPRIRELIAECVVSLNLDSPDELHQAIRSALHELLDLARSRRLIRERSAS